MSTQMYIQSGMLPNMGCPSGCDKRPAKIESWIRSSATALGLDNLREISRNSEGIRPESVTRLLGLCTKREGELQAINCGPGCGDDVQPGESDPNDYDSDRIAA